MTRAADCLDQTLKALHDVEDKLEHENALNPDARLSDAEIAVHECIGQIERIRRGEGGSAVAHVFVDNSPDTYEFDR